jgi:hypothetical protein
MRCNGVGFTRLKTLFQRPALFVLAGGINPIGAKMAEALGYDAFYMSGGNTSAHQLGWPDSGTSMCDVVDPPEPSRAQLNKARLAAVRKAKWVVYAKRPFGGPGAVLAYLSRYTHRIAIANSRLVAFDGQRVTFKWKDYRAKSAARYKLMTLDADEFIRRFLIHVLPDRFHRIRHYGVFANANRAANIALARRLLGAPSTFFYSIKKEGTRASFQA